MEWSMPTDSGCNVCGEEEDTDEEEEEEEDSSQTGPLAAADQSNRALMCGPVESDGQVVSHGCWMVWGHTAWVPVVSSSTSKCCAYPSLWANASHLA